MTDFIYDDLGKNVAWIDGVDVYSVRTRKKIATREGSRLIDLEGNFIGNLENAFKVRGDGDVMSPRFQKLLGE